MDAANKAANAVDNAYKAYKDAASRLDAAKDAAYKAALNAARDAARDATNMAATAVVDGDEVVINGSKWFSTGIGNPDCRILVFMGVTRPDAGRVSSVGRASHS